MLNKFFHVVAQQSEVVNLCTDSKQGTIKFSQMFAVLFPHNGFKTEDNIVSWLEVFGNQFNFSQNYWKLSIVEKVRCLFQNLKFDPEAKENIHIYQYWLFLFHIYEGLIKTGYKDNDHIGEFMNGFPIHHTKVVILGNDPAKNVVSSGYAFHGSACESTSKILWFLQKEMNIVADYNEVKRIKIVADHENPNMRGWIRQGVLMMNTHLTYNSDGCVISLWNYFTEFILKYLSKTLNHVVFIFLGEINDCKHKLIDQNRHLTISLYHPAKYSYEDNSYSRTDRDWGKMIPFINANFYRYQAGKNRLVDGGNVNGLNSERKNVRLDQLRNLFEEAIELGDPTEGSCRRIEDDLIVVMNDEAEEYFTLKYWPTL